MTWIKHDVAELKPDNRPTGNVVMRRRGWRGKWFTFYVHHYIGHGDRTERYHTHPWLLSISVVLHGWFVEEIRAPDSKVMRWAVGDRGERRRWLSVRLYPWWLYHRVRHVAPGSWSLFICFMRSQEVNPPEPGRRSYYWLKRCGWAHYTELNAREYDAFRESRRNRGGFDALTRDRFSGEHNRPAGS